MIKKEDLLKAFEELIDCMRPEDLHMDTFDVAIRGTTVHVDETQETLDTEEVVTYNAEVLEMKDGKWNTEEITRKEEHYNIETGETKKTYEDIRDVTQ